MVKKKKKKGKKKDIILMKIEAQTARLERS